jgi:hypothetical protein
MLCSEFSNDAGAMSWEAINKRLTDLMLGVPIAAGNANYGAAGAAVGAAADVNVA